MNKLEIIDRLCAVTTSLADIVREQTMIIEQHRMLDDESGAELTAKRNAVGAELDLIEYGLRPFVPFSCGKEE